MLCFLLLSTTAPHSTHTKKRIEGLFVWSRDHCLSPCYYKYLKQTMNKRKKNVKIAAWAATNQRIKWRTNVKAYKSRHIHLYPTNMVFLEWGGTGQLFIGHNVKSVAWAYAYQVGSEFRVCLSQTRF